MNTPDSSDPDFQLDPAIIYLNHAAVSPWPVRTEKAVIEFAKENARLGSKHYPRWMEKESKLRTQISELINAPSGEDIALVKNTSEALSIVAYGLCREENWNENHNIVISNQEFPSNSIIWESLARKYGMQIRYADLNSGENPEQALIRLTDENTVLLSISAVQYSTGLRIDLPVLGDWCHRQNILFCVDAIQAVGAIPIDVQGAGIDFAMADGHKWMLGPEGLGFFYCRSDLRDRLELLQYGWHMVEQVGNYDLSEWQPATSARRFECGSPNMLGVHALSASLSVLEDHGMEKIESLILDRARFLFDEVRQSRHLELLTDSSDGRFAGIVTFRHRQADNQLLYQSLMKQNVICAHRGGGIRYSPHFYTPLEQLASALQLADNFTQ